MVWYSHLFQNFPHFIVIHAVKSFGAVNEADVFLKLSCFLDDPMDVGGLVSGSSAFSKPVSLWYLVMAAKVQLVFRNQGSMGKGPGS